MVDRPKPCRGPFQRAAEAAAGRLLLHHPEAPTRARPVMGEPEKVEALFAGVPWLTASVRRGPEVEQAGLGRVEGQAVLAKTFRQHVQDPMSVRLTGEHN